MNIKIIQKHDFWGLQIYTNLKIKEMIVEMYNTIENAILLPFV